MALNTTTGTVNVTGSVTSTPSTGTVLCITGTAQNGTTTLGTVPANKIWYIVGMALTGYAGGTATLVSLKLDATTFIQQTQYGTAGDNATQRPIVVMFPSKEQCPSLAATKTITLVSNNTGTGMAMVYYVEESV